MNNNNCVDLRKVKIEGEDMNIDNLIKERNIKLKEIKAKDAIFSLVLSAQRLSKSYHFFAQQYNLNALWYDELIVKFLDKRYKSLEEIINFIEEKIPDSEDYPELWSNIAQDVTIVLLKIYYYLKTKDIKDIFEGFATIDNSFDFYLQEAEEINYQIQYIKDLTIKELKWEIEIFKLLELKEDREKILQMNKIYFIPTCQEIFGM